MTDGLGWTLVGQQLSWRQYRRNVAARRRAANTLSVSEIGVEVFWTPCVVTTRLKKTDARGVALVSHRDGCSCPSVERNILGARVRPEFAR